MYKKILQKISRFFRITVLCFSFHVAQAANYDLQIPIPKGQSSVSGPSQYIQMIFKYGLSIVGITALTAMVIGGFIYLTSGGNETRKKSGKEWMWGAVMGLVLLLCSWLILYTINPQLTKLSEPALKKIELTGHTGYTILSPDIPQAYSQVQGSYGDMVSKYSQENGVPSNIVNGVIMAESKGDPNAVGPPTKYGTAKGLMQLLDGTAKDMGVTDVFNPEQNIKGGTRYLGQLYNYYGGNMDNALAAYNWGPGNMDKYLAGQKSMPAETQKYIANVYNYSRQGAPQSPVM